MTGLPKLELPFSYIARLHCSGCGKIDSAIEANTFCPECNSPLLAEYDLDLARQRLSREDFSARPKSMWRWHELLPVQLPQYIVSLGEGETPLLGLPRLGKQLGFENLFLKDEGRNPLHSLKARGISVAISKARELGIQKVIVPTTGNTGVVVAAYAAQAGMKAHLLMPKEVPQAKIAECLEAGAEVALVDGLISDAAGLVGEKARAEGWFDLSSFKEPYRLEGKKTIGYELAESFGWKLPDVIIYPTGAGAGLVALWKAFAELETLRWLELSKRPRLVAVQAKGCAPFVKAFETRASFCDFWTNASTIASGLRVPKSFADHLVLRDLYASHGMAIAVTDEAIRAAQYQLDEEEGLAVSLEGAASLAALIQLRQQRWIKPGERIVLLNGASGSHSPAPAA
jgi:threonine synthase